MVRALMCLELILNAVNMNLITFSDLFDSRQLKGDNFSIFVIAIAAAEAAIGPTIPKLCKHVGRSPPKHHKNQLTSAYRERHDRGGQRTLLHQLSTKHHKNQLTSAYRERHDRDDQLTLLHQLITLSQSPSTIHSTFQFGFNQVTTVHLKPGYYYVHFSVFYVHLKPGYYYVHFSVFYVHLKPGYYYVHFSVFYVHLKPGYYYVHFFVFYVHLKPGYYYVHFFEPFGFIRFHLLHLPIGFKLWFHQVSLASPSNWLQTGYYYHVHFSMSTFLNPLVSPGFTSNWFQPGYYYVHFSRSTFLNPSVSLAPPRF
ncbi:uncharacterized protein LOC110007852 [Amborella trichopoda]|uniref:uncharacterized protein LOC110007852 n=1 Tax=Amborella trichopoda TaxID=13333 RepID=UPI0009BD3AD7|nr:uncharacterized protein LOC110007852 [Amborella trichopoda]|eukprot:XP_020527252.1 uncharacterized protein LOC110007852 [Amborella trichopoda]